jgi:ferric-dicitrate binding protein FerR (iron transport regulator)
MTKYSLPDGSAHALPLTQARRAWQVWLALAPVAACRAEGVAIAKDGDNIEITTVYAPHGGGVRVVCLPDGTAVWCSDQDAPAVDCDFLAEPPPGPWERPPRG